MNRSVRFGRAFILVLSLIMVGSSAGVVMSADRGAGRTRPAVDGAFAFYYSTVQPFVNP